MPHEVGAREESVEETVDDSHNNNNNNNKQEQSTGTDPQVKEEDKIRVDGAYKKRVMDDLDALLADLQNTTAHISSYQHSQQGQPLQHQHQQQLPPPPPPQQQQSLYQTVPVTSYNINSGEFPPPPPPPPDQEDLRGFPQQHHQQQYFAHQRQQQQQRLPNQYLPQQPQPLSAHNPNQFPQPPPPSELHYHSIDPVTFRSQGQGEAVSAGEVVTVRRESYNSSDGNSGGSTPPPLPPPPPSEVLDSLAYAHSNIGHLPGVYTAKPFQPPSHLPPTEVTGPPPQLPPDVVQTRSQVKGRGERMSALSNNLSELDQLLQDLNSAQFMAEVDRKSSVNDVPVVVNGVNKQAPPVAPKPGSGVRTGQRNTVDSLLDDLEGTPRFPVDPMYQEVGAIDHSQNIGGISQDGYSGVHSSSSSSSPYPPQSSSTATKELDDLMMSLSEFKIQNKNSATASDPNQEPAYAKPMKSRSAGSSNPTSPNSETQLPLPQGENGQLESMLGDLQSDMNKQGVNTKQKGVCAACNKPIVGQLIAALGQTWHIEHFTCAHCEEPLGTRNFYERDGMAYCETDYHHLFAPRCAYCNGPIVDKCITALEKMWHPEHFFCAQCGHPFGEEDFHEKNGKAYCKEDYFQIFAPRCGGCAQPIMDNYISALTRQWHPHCFVCWDCRAPFGNGSFFDYEGLPYCETHYHAKKGSLCASCEKPITGRCITAMFKKFHPEHFVCAFCLKQLNKGTFKEQNDKPYCHPCFVKLFG